MELLGVVVTDRLLLRRVGDRDIPALVDLRQRAPVREFVGGALTRQVARAKATACVNTPDWYAVVRLDDQRVIDLVSLTLRGSETELSYEFVPDEWGHGLATEACAALLEAHAAVGNGGGVVAVTQRANQRSRRLLERLGMTEREEFAEYGAAQALYAAAPDCP